MHWRAGRGHSRSPDRTERACPASWYDRYLNLGIQSALGIGIRSLFGTGWRMSVLQLLNGLTFAALLFVVASGFTLIFGLLRIVNLAHGALYLLGGYIG